MRRISKEIARASTLDPEVGYNTEVRNRYVAIGRIVPALEETPLEDPPPPEVASASFVLKTLRMAYDCSRDRVRLLNQDVRNLMEQLNELRADLEAIRAERDKVSPSPC